jgi:hypothetical protein
MEYHTFAIFHPVRFTNGATRVGEPQNPIKSCKMLDILWPVDHPKDGSPDLSFRELCGEALI